MQNDFRVVRSAEDQNYWDLVGPNGKIYISQESFTVVDGVLDSIKKGAVGCSELDEVAANILESIA